MSVSPLTIEIMLECATCSEPGANIPDQIWNSVAAAEVRAWLHQHGLIEVPGFEATERGKAWVDFICSTPLPVRSWTLPDRHTGAE